MRCCKCLAVYSLVFLACGLNAGRAQGPAAPLEHPPRAESDLPASPGTPPPQLEPPDAEIQPVAAQGWTLEQIEVFALENHPTLVRAAMAVQSAEGRYLQAGLYPNPNVFYRGEEIGNGGRQGLQGAGFSQQIVTAHKRQRARTTASYAIDQARFDFDAQRSRVLNDARIGFYAVLLAQRLLDVNHQLVDVGRRGVETTQKLHAARSVSLTDVLQSRIEFDTARLRLNQASNRHDAAWRQLAAVIGDPCLAPQPLAGDAEADLPQLTWEEALEAVMSRSPELSWTVAGVERARQNLGLQYARRIPNVTFEATSLYDTESYSTVATAGLAVPVPLFNRNQGNILQAQSQVIAAEREVQRVQLDLRNRLAATFEQYANARQQFETYRDRILPAAKESLDLNELGYQQGEFDYLTLLTAQRTFFQANLAYLQSLSQLRARGIELEGLLLINSLTADN